MFLNTASLTAQDVKAPTKKELVSLLKTAKEPADHLRIAAYYTQEAARLRSEAKEHSELAAIYARTHPFAAMESKHGYAWSHSAAHCKKFAQLALDEAKQADALAAPHKDIQTPQRKNNSNKPSGAAAARRPFFSLGLAIARLPCGP